MNPWLWAATGLLLALVPCLVTCFRGRTGDRLAGLNMASSLTVLVLLLVAEGYHRTPFLDVALTATFLLLGGGLVFARFVERWL